MAQTKQCTKCGAEIPNDARLGICPKCLFDLGFPLLGELSNQSTQNFGEQGRRFGDYELGRQLGCGGMGVVYEALQVSLRRPVALKMIRDLQEISPEARHRFTIEAEAAAKLDHPNIVPIYEVGEHNNHPFLSMKLVQGESLRHKIARGEIGIATKNDEQTKSAFRLRAAAVVRLMARGARAVHHAHGHGVLHRDVKPGNILVDRDGQPHLIDFGLAKILGEGVETRSGIVSGTPSYMSPEQASGQRLSPASDIYSLGAILYELLTGQPPFKASTALETMRLVIEQEAKPPSAFYPRLDKDLDTICLKCLEKIPEARYQSAEVLAEDLERWLRQEPIRARPVGPVMRVSRWARRNPVGTALILTLCAGLVTALVLLQIALERQQRLNLQRAHLVDMFTQEAEDLWKNPDKTHVHFHSSQLAALADTSPREIDAETVKLTVGKRINHDPVGQAINYAPVLRLLEEKMEKSLRRRVLFDLRLYKLSGGAVNRPAAEGEVDFQRVGPVAYVRAGQAALGLELVVREQTSKEAVIFARKDSGITSLREVAGHRVAFAHTNSIISFLAKVYLARAGIGATNLKSHENLEREDAARPEGETDPDSYAHKAVVRRVLANEFDAGESQRRHFEMHKHKGLVELHSYTVTPDVYVARTGLAPEVVQAFRQALVSLQGRREKKLLERLESSPIRGFEFVTDRAFDDLRSALTNELMRFESVQPNSSTSSPVP